MAETRITQRAILVASYRRDLAEHWGICPMPTTGQGYAKLTPEDRVALRKAQGELLASDDAGVHARFYDWLADRRRFGPVHSLKWMEIVAGGIWAAAALAAFVPDGAVLDLGCNAGYWVAWLAEQRGGPVVGVDACAAAIELGQRRMAEKGLSGELRWGDFEKLVFKEAFVAAVSLQGLTRHFHGGAFDVLGKAAANLRNGGYLILVDELPGERAEYDRAFAAAGLALIAAGPVGGLGIDDEWKSYTGLVLQRRADGLTHERDSLGQAESAVEDVWKEIHPFATADSLDWSQRNTAYWWAEGGDALVDV
jgi:SAM-dependent methyltransferase